MPFRDGHDSRFNNGHLPTHEFPPAFPKDFPLDTPYIYQAIEEHNRERMQAGLPAQNYLQLSVAERHDVLGRANRIKVLDRASASEPVRAKVIPMVGRDSSGEKGREMYLLEREGKHFNVLGWVFLLGGISLIP